VQVTLYFKVNSEEPLDSVEKLKVEIIGRPETVQKLVRLVRREVESWRGWAES